MRWLELKIPPPILLMLTIIGMWGLSFVPPSLTAPLAVRVAVALLLALIGVSLSGIGLRTFARAKTTFDPHQPQDATTLVTTGIYSWTRNPMYLGMLTVTIGWSGFLCSLPSLIGPVFFAFYITQFQIKPEERILKKLFGQPYTDYKTRTRRWL
jgi:protein-S-isoprenylcysteine O-methyltransferase Ste14